MQSVTGSEKPLVVLVEDDQGTRMLFGITLEVEGFEVVTYENGEEALEGLGGVKPAAIVTDLTLSGELSGIELARALRSRADLDGVDLFAITGWDLDRIPPADVALFRKVFLKPIDTMIISDAIRAAIGS